MIKTRRLSAALLSALFLAGTLSGCAGSAGGSAAGTGAYESAAASAEQAEGGSSDQAGAESGAPEGDAAAAASSQEVHPVLAVGIDAPQFPDMDIVVPTTEPAPEYIRIGTRSWIVKDLQARLMELGFMDNDEPTEYYGEATQSAVKIYQRQNKLAQDGIVGVETLQAILDENAHYYVAQQGDSGTDIEDLQQRLYQLGYLADSSDVSGNFGDKTLAAVQKFQQMNELEQDGKVGRKTMNLIYSDEVKPNMVAYGEQSDIVLAAQKRLYELGYLTSTPDGNFGLGTVMAVKEFQSRNDQVIDGYLGPGTRAALNSDDAQPFGLVLGDQSETVTQVQKLLNKWGYLSSSLITGYYGDATKQAVVDFQKRNDLSADGSVGAMTMAKLTSENARRPAPKPAATTAARQRSSSGGGSQSASGSGRVDTSGGGSGRDAGSGGEQSSYVYTGGGSVGDLLSVASSKLGKPYVWGAKGPNSFDCSGFVYWCLNQVGVNQSYMTSGGWASSGRGRRISSFSDLQAGDIIVVSGHVGICAGGGTVIDASSSNGRVVHRNLSSWWQRNFICGWRIF